MMSDVEKRKCRERVRRMGPAGQGRPHGGSEILEEMRWELAKQICEEELLREGTAGPKALWQDHGAQTELSSLSRKSRRGWGGKRQR